MYVNSLKLMLTEIGYALRVTLQRGFSKYNSICYLESYKYFIEYIKEKIIDKYNNLPSQKDNYSIENLSEILVNVSNAFYKSVLTLDSSVMHSERRFIMSDPHQLTLFYVPPKIIAYYTAIANEMANTLNGNSLNRYVFLITPDIKKDIYVESITNNRDIGKEINILVIHIHERSIYNVTDTTKILAHEIAHHVGQDEKLRKQRAHNFIKCYIAYLVSMCLDFDAFSPKLTIKSIVEVFEEIIEDIFVLVRDSDVFKDAKNFYYLDNLQDYFYEFISKELSTAEKLNTLQETLYNAIENRLGDCGIQNYIAVKRMTFVPEKSDLSKDIILHGYVVREIFETAIERLQKCIFDPVKINIDLEPVRFVFKEGYADTQMLLLTENIQSNESDVIKNYLTRFEPVKNKIDEMLRNIAVINAFNDGDNVYSDIIKSNILNNCELFNKVYYMYICKQASLYFKSSKNHMSSSFKGTTDTFDYTKVSMFKTGQICDVVRQIDDTISSYIEKIL